MKTDVAPGDAWRRHLGSAGIRRLLAAFTFSCSFSRCEARLRDDLLSIAKDRLEVFYADSSKLLPPLIKDGVSYQLSKEDKVCGGAGVPLVFVEYTLDNVRPVDAFNVMVDSATEPEWDDVCMSFEPLMDSRSRQSRGFAATWDASPLSAREEFKWQAVKANFTSEEFWVVFSTLDNEVLQQRKPLGPGNVEMQSCLVAYRITKADNLSAHVAVTEQINSQLWPVSARDVANQAGPTMVKFAHNFGHRALEQAAEGWPANRTAAPSWMLEDKPCAAAPPDVDLRTSLLRRAAEELNRTSSERGVEEPQSVLPGGEVVERWRRDEECGSGTGAQHKVPVWSAEFEIPGATPSEVFAVAVATAREPQWNPAMVAVNVTGFKSGARGLHEALSLPLPLSGDREVWERQVATHDLDHDTFLLASASSSAPSSPPFSDHDELAFRCLQVLQVRPAQSGARVFLSSSFNPNLKLDVLEWYLWKKRSGDVLLEYVRRLSSEVVRLVHSRSLGPVPPASIDGDALVLLAPSPPDTNESMTLAEVLSSKSDLQLLRRTAALNVPVVLRASDWSDGVFQDRASELLQLLQRLAANASKAEAATIAKGAASDALALQAQGEALASIQMRIRATLAENECSDHHIPDINGNGKGGGLAVWICIVLLVLCLALVAGCSVCAGYQVRRIWRQKRAMRAAAVLLDESLTGSHRTTNGSIRPSGSVSTFP